MPPPESRFVKLPEPPEEIIAPFKSTPWAMKFFSDPTIHAITNESRIIKHLTTAGTLLARTLATEDTIKAWQSFRRDEPDEEGRFGEVLSLVSIGSGVNGHIDISHGGFVGVLLDEALGLSAENYRPADKTTMTAYLKVYSSNYFLHVVACHAACNLGLSFYKRFVSRCLCIQV